jgi:hypothetical protein
MADTERAAAYFEWLRLYVETFEELEIVLTLARAGECAQTPPAVAADAKLPIGTVEAVIERLVRLGLLVSKEGPQVGYHINWSDTAMATGVEQLRAEYESNRLGVMSQMSANALERVRGSAIRAFARAFLLRDKRDG